MPSKKVTGTLVLVLVHALAWTIAAQPPAQHMQMVRIHVKPGFQAQFAEYMKKLIEAADKTAAPQSWVTTQGVLGTSGTDYFVTLGFNKWAERDAWGLIPQMLAKAFGEAEAQRIQKMGGDAIWSFETTLFSLDAERSLHVDRSTEANYYQVLIGQVKPDLAQEYQSVVAALMQAQEKAGSQQMWIRRSSRYGKSWQSYAAVPFNKWGDWDQTAEFWANVTKAVGEGEANRLQSRLQACYEEREIFVVQRIPELSRSAPSTSN